MDPMMVTAASGLGFPAGSFFLDRRRMNCDPRAVALSTIPGKPESSGVVLNRPYVTE